MARLSDGVTSPGPAGPGGVTPSGPAGTADLTLFALFVRLKGRLILGSLRGDTAKQIGFVFSVLAAVVCGAGGFLLFALLRMASPGTALDAGVVVFAVFTIGWALIPLVFFGLDETLDPSRLALFPLSTRQLAIGMTAASATGPWPLATLAILAGGIAGLSRGPGGVVIGLLAVALQFVLCLVVSRLITTALSGALRSRRGRDVLAVAAVFVVLAFQLPNLIVNRSNPGDVAGLFSAAADVLRWTPPGLAAHAIADGGIAGVADLAAVAVVVVVLAWAWIAALRRALVLPDASNQGGGSVRRSWIERFLPRGMLGAVVSKELKYARREPRGRIAWFSAIVVSGVIMFSIRGDAGPSGPGSVAGPACLAALMIGLQAGNVFGLDGRSFWMNAVAFPTEREMRTDLAGRHLGTAIIAVPLLAVVALVAGLLMGDASWALPAALTAWGVLGVTLGAGAVASVLLPYTVPERLNAFSGAAPGQGGLAFVSSLGMMLASAAVALPIFLPVAMGLTWVAPLAVPYGLLAAWGGRRLAASLGFGRMPEIFAAVSRGS
ncbi:transporter [Planotetraspora thailandica]|uniref:Transporter n=1 Tax=Planotetraspora thailandica TaxID=487172 RepID=A0A8J3XUF6_9ACTN|nr:hypothetical protein [Planotetraspora thailandica]GII53224.1 transporter [Planotetraspora thailandica]